VVQAEALAGAGDAAAVGDVGEQTGDGTDLVDANPGAAHHHDVDHRVAEGEAIADVDVAEEPFGDPLDPGAVEVVAALRDMNKALGAARDDPADCRIGRNGRVRCVR
jgi:hypothetical protein